jgi:hypothetical protein
MMKTSSEGLFCGLLRAFSSHREAPSTYACTKGETFLAPRRSRRLLYEALRVRMDEASE